MAAILELVELDSVGPLRPKNFFRCLFLHCVPRVCSWLNLAYYCRCYRGQITLTEFIDGAARLRGGAKAGGQKTERKVSPRPTRIMEKTDLETNVIP